MPEEVKCSVLRTIDLLPVKQKSKVYQLVHSLYLEEGGAGKIDQMRKMHSEQIGVDSNYKPSPVRVRVHQGPPDSQCLGCEG